MPSSLLPHFLRKYPLMKQSFFSRHIFDKFRKQEPWWKRFLLVIWTFFLSRKGILALFVLFFISLGIWGYVSLSEFRIFFGDLPQILGFWGEKRYLLLLENENERRPTGGFITSFAVIESRGIFQNLQFYNSEEVETPNPQVKAPDAVERVFSRDPKYAGWVFRDTNFSFDFSENAKKALEFLSYDSRFADMHFDGVIAVDMSFITDVVGLLEPFSLGDETLTKKNFFELLEFTAKNFDLHDEEAWRSRKNTLYPLAHEIFKKLALHPGYWDDFFIVTAKNFQNKHITAYLEDPDLQAKFLEKNWAGTIPSQNFWSINFANLGGRKVDRYLQKDFHSSLHVDELGKIVERFSIHIVHEGTYNLQSDHYETFVRIVRPQGTVFLNSGGKFETPPRGDTRPYGEEISFFLTLDPGEEKLLQFTFELPGSFSEFPEKSFLISIFKQVGSSQDEWDFTMRGENDVRFSAEGCDKIQSHENVFFCDLSVKMDESLVFTLHPDKTPPLLQFAEFLTSSELEIRFSEDISPGILHENISLLTLDNSSEELQTIPIQKVRQEGENIFLDLEKSVAPGQKKFQLIISNVEDLSGNYFEGSEKGLFKATITR
ncbi:DUF4012 domain-containing protein [Candidatus Peregrinibacteria bacterium]|nr:DUF4012 domain-containing protein [Candidatus Peregrinibacteria bacterium]